MNKFRKISLFSFGCWLAVGIFVLCGDSVSHLSYFLCWLALIVGEIFNCIYTCLDTDGEYDEEECTND